MNNRFQLIDFYILVQAKIGNFVKKKDEPQTVFELEIQVNKSHFVCHKGLNLVF